MTQDALPADASSASQPAAAPNASRRGEIRLHPTWLAAVGPEFETPHMQALRTFLHAQVGAGKRIHPAPARFFAALDRTPLDQVKCVILGQDPYHGPNQAHGLCFSVQHGVEKPPSLQNIFKELHDDLGVAEPPHGCLEAWADQGVLLLNSVLSVEESRPASHSGKGWEQLTDAIIHAVNERRENVAFVLWGSYAQKKAEFVDRKRHFVLRSPHPSPLSAYRGFFGSRPFSKVNAYLAARGVPEIDWRIS